MSTIVLFGNGVQTRWTLPATSVQIESVVFTGVGPAWSLVENNVIAFVSPMPIDMQAAVEFTDLGTYGGSGSGGGLTPEQYNDLVQDTELAAVETNLLNNAGAVAGEVRMFTTVNGNAPGGWAKSSGFVVPSGLFTLNKFGVTNGLAAFHASNSTKSFRVQAGTGNVTLSYDYGTGQNSTYAVGPWGSSYSPNTVIASETHLYAFGGASGSVVNTSAARMVITTGVWSSLPAMPAARCNSVAAEQADGQLVIFGGSSNLTVGPTVLTDTVWRYNPSTGLYATLSPLPFRASSGYTCRKANGTIFAIWSVTSDGTTSTGNRAVIFDPATGVSTQLDNPPFAGPVFELSDGRVVVVNQSTLANTVAYDASQPSGSRYVAYGLTAPTGVVSVTTFQPAIGFTRLVQGSLLPMALNATGVLSGVLWTTSTPADFLGSFYAVKQ